MKKCLKKPISMIQKVRPRQLYFPFLKISLEHGGDINKGKRKIARPVDTKRAMHVVLRSTRAKGPYSLLTYPNQKYLRYLFGYLQRSFPVKIYEFANVGNHLHIVVRAKTRSGFRNFLRTLTALLARRITGAKKGNPSGKFWDGLAYTKVIKWGRHFRNLKNYIAINQLEALGWIDRAVQKSTGQVLLRDDFG